MFQAVIEKQVADSEKRFDVHLERNGVTIACEVSFTTTVDHEIGNISLAPPALEPPKEPKKRGGRTVKRTQSSVSAEEKAAREEEYNRAIAEALKRKQK